MMDPVLESAGVKDFVTTEIMPYKLKKTETLKRRNEKYCVT